MATVRYSNIERACSLLDMTVLTDLSSDGTCAGDCSHWYQVFSIGQRSELSAGIRQFEYTPFFKTMEQLDTFCAKHMNVIEKHAELDGLIPYLADL